MRLLNERHLDGIIDGIVSYNVLLQENNTKKIFCLSSDLVLTVQQAEEIINHVAHRLAKPDDVPISVLLVVGCRKRFHVRKGTMLAVFFRYLDPPKLLHHMFPPLADPFKRRFGLVVARFRMVHRNFQCRITDVLDVQFRVTSSGCYLHQLVRLEP